MNFTKPYTRIFLCLLALLTVVSVGCREKPQQENSAHLRVGISIDPLSALILIADEERLFAREKLAVIISEFPLGKTAFDSLLDGKVDIAATPDIPIVLESFSRDNFAVIASIASAENDARIIARRDRGITAPKSLKGHKVATAKGTGVHFYLHNFLLQNGLNENEIDLVYLPAEEVTTALTHNKVDAFCIREPYISAAKEALGANAVIFSTGKIALKTYNTVARCEILTNRGNDVDKFLRALVEAERFVSANPAKAVTIVARRLGMKEQALAELWPQLTLRVSLDQALIVAMEDEARWASSANLVSSDRIPDYLNFVDPHPLARIKPDAVTMIYDKQP